MMARFRRTVDDAATVPSSKDPAASRTVRAVPGSASAFTGFVLRETQLRMAAASSGQSPRCFVLNVHFRSAVRMVIASGLPLSLASIAGMTRMSAHAMFSR